MNTNNFGGFAGIDDYVKHKLSKYEKEEKTLETLFRYMFDESDNVMAESTDGYRIKKITYGEFKAKILAIAPTVKKALCDVKAGELVGIYMQNSMDWIAVFWAVLVSGFNPLLMNTRLPDAVMERILSDNSVRAVISDGKQFSVKTVFSYDVAVPCECGTACLGEPFGTEVVFMSSGTSNNVKLCYYNGENFYNQIRDSVDIIEKCPSIKKHYDGELKQLTLLPFYHVFGFIAVYLWFGFFSRTFVFPNDLNPQTIQNTVKKHKVTHIFAVPMVWEAVYKAAMKKIKSRGSSVYKKFVRMLNITNRLGALGDKLAARAFSEIRDAIFGDSICFLITGGSAIDADAIRFFNGIGYHMANGYGMTEIGITSVEKSDVKKILNSASIGSPFGSTEYSLGESGELLVKGRNMAAKIASAGSVSVTDYDKWFSTGDLAELRDGRYYINGRQDDLIIGSSGENLNPVLMENELVTDGVDRICIFADSKSSPVLIASVPGCFLPDKFKEIYNNILVKIKQNNLEGVIKRILFTPEPLVSGNEFKVSRIKLSERYESGNMKIFDPTHIDEHIEELVSSLENEIKECFAEVLSKNVSEIGLDSNFFVELGGTSIDYFSLLGLLKKQFGVDLPYSESDRLVTVTDFYKYLLKENGEKND